MKEKTTSRGGARRNAGRKTERYDLEVSKRTVSLDPSTLRRLAALGGGNVSLGIRFAATVAFDRYQDGKLELPQVRA